MKSRYLLGTFLLFGLMLLGTAPAGEGATFDQAFGRGESGYQKRDYRAALTAFQEAFSLNPGHVGVNFYLGRVYYELGDYENALMAFDRASILDPESAQVKMELGRTYYELSLRDLAKPYFQEVIDSQPPAAVKQVAEGYLAQIDKNLRHHFFSGALTLGANFDNNIYVSPSSNMVNTAVGPFVLDPANQKQRDWFWTDSLVLDYRYRFHESGWSWHTNGMAYNAWYDTSKDLNLGYYGVMSGPAWENERYALELQGTYYHLDKDYRSYMDSYGAVLNGSMAVTRNLQFTGALRGEDKRYLVAPVRDALAGAVSTGPVWTLGKNRFTAHIGYEKEDATDDVWSFDKYFGTVRYDRVLPWDMTAYLGYRLQAAEYDDPDPVFAHDRSDTIHDAFIGFGKRFTRNLSADFSYTFTHSSSTLDIYDYDRNLFSFSLTLGF